MSSISWSCQTGYLSKRSWEWWVSTYETRRRALVTTGQHTWDERYEHNQVTSSTFQCLCSHPNILNNKKQLNHPFGAWPGSKGALDSCELWLRQGLVPCCLSLGLWWLWLRWPFGEMGWQSFADAYGAIGWKSFAGKMGWQVYQAYLWSISTNKKLG